MFLADLPGFKNHPLFLNLKKKFFFGPPYNTQQLIALYKDDSGL